MKGVDLKRWNSKLFSHNLMLSLNSLGQYLNPLSKTWRTVRRMKPAARKSDALELSIKEEGTSAIEAEVATFSPSETPLSLHSVPRMTAMNELFSEREYENYWATIRYLRL